MATTDDDEQHSGTDTDTGWMWGDRARRLLGGEGSIGQALEPCRGWRTSLGRVIVDQVCPEMLDTVGDEEHEGVVHAVCDGV